MGSFSSPPDPDDATPEGVAEYCGIKYDRAPVDLVPLQEYQETGTVRCDACGQQPDPPWVIVAKWDAGPPICDECLGPELALNVGLKEEPTTAWLYARAGWTAREIDSSAKWPRQEARELIRDTTDVLGPP